MSILPQESVFLVTSTDPDNKRFGTAFSIYSGEGATEYEKGVTYFLTCRHVVTDVGGFDQVRIGGHPATVVASGSEGGLDDMAVLRVDRLDEVPTLRLNVSAWRSSPVWIFGFRSFSHDFLIRPLRAYLGERLGLESRRESRRVLAWDLTILGDHDLEQGYSGGPVVDEERGCVVAIANYRLGGKKGVAISVGILEQIWQGMVIRTQGDRSMAPERGRTKIEIVSEQHEAASLARGNGGSGLALTDIIVDDDRSDSTDVLDFRVINHGERSLTISRVLLEVVEVHDRVTRGFAPVSAKYDLDISNLEREGDQAQVVVSHVLAADEADRFVIVLTAKTLGMGLFRTWTLTPTLLTSEGKIEGPVVSVCLPYDIEKRYPR